VAISVGSVSVDVVPDARRFVPDLRAKLSNLPTVTIPVDAATTAATAAIDKVVKTPRTATVKVSAETSKAKADLDALQKQIRDRTLQINVSTADAKARLAQLQSDIATAKAAVKINADDADAKAKLAALKREAAALRAQLELDTAPARAEIARLQAEANRAKVTVQAEAYTAKADAELARATRDREVNVRVDDRGSILSTTSRMNALLAAGIALGPAIVPAAAAAAAAVGAIGVGALAGVAGIGTLALGFSGVKDAVSAMADAQTSAGRDAAKSAASQVAAAEQVRSAEASLANVRAQARDSAAQAARAVVDAQHGIGDATREAARGVADALAAQATAQRGVAEASRAAATGVRNALQQQVDAQRAVEDATRNAARNVQTALFSQEQAEQSLASAQLAARQAQLSLTQAREDARQSLEDLTLQVEDGALAQRRAALGVQDAQDALDRTMADPKATDRQRELAQLAYDEAAHNLEEIGVRNERLAAEKAAADKAGINGSKQVQAATQGIADAEQRVQDARTGAARAAAAVTEARRAGDESVLAAQQRLADSSAAVAEAQRSGAERVAVARAQLAKAEQGVEDARVRGAERVAAAQQRLSDAQAAQGQQQRQSAFAISQAQAAVASAQRQAASAGEAQSSSMTKVSDAMAALTPQGRKFATFLFSLRGQFDGLKNAAQAGLLPGVQAGIQAVLPLMPILERTVGNAARAMGDLFEQAGKALNSPFWRDFFTMIETTVGPNLTLFGTILGNVATGFAGLLMAFQPVSQQLGAGLLALSQRFADFGKGASTSSGFQSFLDYVQRVGPLVFATIGSLATTIGRVAVALAPIGVLVLQSIKFLADQINRIPINVLGTLLTIVGTLILSFQLFTVGLTVFNAVAAANPVALVVIALAALAAGAVYAYTHFDGFRKVVDAAWAAIQLATSSAWRVMAPVFSAIGTFVVQTIPQAFRAGGAAIDTAWTAIKNRIAAVWNVGIKTPLSALNTFVTVTVPEAFRSGGRAIDTAWTAIKNRIAAVWNIGIKTPLKALNDFVTVTVPEAFRAGGRSIDTAWTAIKNRIAAVWDVGIKTPLKALNTFITSTVPEAFRAGGRSIDTAWTAIKNRIAAVWNIGIKEPLTALKDFITVTLPAAFTSGVAAIKTAWDTVQDVAKNPVKFVVNTVLNNGLIAAFNKINSALGSPIKKGIPTFTLPAGFARGTEDHRAQIAHPGQPRLWAEPETGGEAYIPLHPAKRQRSAAILGDVARRFGYGLVRMANGGTLLQAGRHLRDLGYNVAEGPDGFGPIHHVHAPHSRHYDGMALDINHGAGTSKAEQSALGRIVPYLQGLGLRVIFMAPGHYNHLHTEVPRGAGVKDILGGIKAGALNALGLTGAADAISGLDPTALISGPLAGLLAKVPGKDSVFGRLVSGAPRMLADMLVKKAEGLVSAIAGTGGDLKDVGAGTGGFGGASRWTQLVMVALNQLHRPGSELGAVLRRIQFESGGNPKAINLTDINARRGHPSQGLMQTIPGTFNAYAGPYRSRGITDPLANIYAGINYALHTYGSLAAIDPRNRPRGYDAGGYLMPGLSTVYNGTGKPEPVFTAEQFDAMRQGGGGSRVGVQIHGDVITATPELFAREVTARQRLDEALHPMFA
jgi:hypothetical protein